MPTIERPESLSMTSGDREASDSGWMERRLRPAQEGKWIERRNLGVAQRAGDPGYPHQLTVVINWDGPAENEEAGLRRSHDLVAEALALDRLCLHALTFEGNLEWDLIFYTGAPAIALAALERAERQLPDATLIPEAVEDPAWSYYRAREAAALPR
jgi:hypothetical protein